MAASHDTPTFHRDAQLCRHLLGSITTPHSLEIRESEISQAGSGLFALNDIPEGEGIFGSSPLAECVAAGYEDSVCDLCYTTTLSRVHPSGRFRTKDDALPEMIACTGCGKCWYCSKGCQDKAWEAYHRHECDLLARHPESDARTRALYRILTRESNGLLSPEDKSALDGLESHHESHLSGPDAASIKEIAKEAKERTGTSRSTDEVSRLYCAVCGVLNRPPIQPANCVPR